MKPLTFELPDVKGASIVVEEDILPHFYNRYHKHEHIQITAILKGTGELTTRSGTQPFSAGDVFIIGRNTPHVFCSTMQTKDQLFATSNHAIHIYFKNDFLVSSSLPELEVPKNFLQKIGTGLRVNREQSGSFIDQMHKINDSKGLTRICLFLELLQYCNFNLEKFSTLSPLDSRALKRIPQTNLPRINAVYEFTLANFSKDISINTIANVANMAQQGFCRFFKKSTRKTYMSFLEEVRIDYACRKLLEGNFTSIAEIAYASGFKNPIVFNRAFKRQTQKTPLKFVAEYDGKMKRRLNTKSIEKYLDFQ